MARVESCLIILFVLTGCFGGSAALAAPGQIQALMPLADLGRVCDAGPQLSAEERTQLFERLTESPLGARILTDYAREYGDTSSLMIQWDSVSYSQVVTVHQNEGRAPAGLSALGNAVCVHLTKRLPDIEHVADLAHELTHATRLSPAVLRGNVSSVAEFVQARLAARGGEADAFASECRVKHELLGEWDELCAPYVAEQGSFDTEHVVRDLYSGKMSASLTGETYPVMLARQFNAMAAKRSAAKKVAKPSTVSYPSAAYGGP